MARCAWTSSRPRCLPTGWPTNVAGCRFEFHRRRVWLGSGGGITAASDPAAEYRECLVKAAPLVRALSATLSESSIPAPR